MPMMRQLVAALSLTSSLAVPMSERLASLEQKVKVHELEQRVASLQAGTVKEEFWRSREGSKLCNYYGGSEAKCNDYYEKKFPKNAIIRDGYARPICKAVCT